MRLYRRCQRCNGQVDENEESVHYGHQKCLRVLDTTDNGVDPQNQLDRTLAAGWFDRAVRMTKAAKLFDAALAGDDNALRVDSRACAECVKALFGEYDVRLQDLVFFVQAYYQRIGDLNEKSASKTKRDEVQVDGEDTDEDDDNAEAELEQLLREEAELERKEVALKARLERGKRQAVAIRAEERELLEERNTIMTLQESRLRRLQQHQKYRVHEDLFSIARDGEFPVINGFRLGSSPAIPIEWDEINAALGEVALLLHVCASKLSFQFRSFRPVAIGNVSRMEQVGGAKEAYMLAGSFRTAVMSSQFNLALGALLTATDQMAQAVGRKFGVAPPYKVTSDMIGDSKGDWYSVKRPMRDSAKWVRALLYLLGELKWLLSIVVSADTRAPADRSASNNSLATPPSAGKK